MQSRHMMVSGLTHGQAYCAALLNSWLQRVGCRSLSTTFLPSGVWGVPTYTLAFFACSVPRSVVKGGLGQRGRRSSHQVSTTWPGCGMLVLPAD